MTDFTKYMHIERLNSQEVDGVLDGRVYVFYKIDGTNASVWYNDEKGIQAGSRNRELSEEKDNAEFCKYVNNEINLINFFHHEENREYVLYGEWLVPHSLKTYRNDAWKRFYVFDILDTRTGLMVPYDALRAVCEAYDLEYVPPIAIIKDPTLEDLYKCLEKCGEFLVEDGKGKGEGIVIKNYDFVNRYGRQVWGKIITNEFKAEHLKEMGAPEINGSVLIEEEIIHKYMTEEFIKKEQAKIINSKNEGLAFEIGVEHNWDNRWIPELLGRVWYEFIREETTNFLKEYRNPKINFRLMNALAIKKTKEVIGL
jgi:hypothetical protein